MWQSRRIRLSEITRENCIPIVKQALYIAEGAWSTHKQDELLSFARQIKKDAQAQKHAGNFKLYEIGRGISEYAFMLNRQLDSDVEDLPPMLRASDYIEQEIRIIKDIRASVFAYIRESLSEEKGLSLEEAEVMMALSGEYELTFSDDF
jgi:hypothetical protein